MQCECQQDNCSPYWFQTLLRQQGIGLTSPGGPSRRFLILGPEWSIQGEPLGRAELFSPRRIIPSFP
jgi:hypothetical protein